MRSLKHFSFSPVRQEPEWKRYGIDTLIATIGALFVTLIIYIFQLYPRIPNISLMYLLVVLGVATTRGRYAAICASMVAFLSFDFFLVPPFYQFTIAKFDEWLALFVFLLTAIITGQLASALSRRAEEADQREHETRALYELVSATTNEEHVERQLAIIAHAIVDIFASAGIRDCAILLPDKNGKLSLQADAQQAVQDIQLSTDEQATAALVMKQGTVIDVHRALDTLRNAEQISTQRVRRVVSDAQDKNTRKDLYIRMIPLKIGQRSLGVMRLLMDAHSYSFVDRQSIATGGTVGATRGQPDQRTAFFWTFLDQATSVIEHARLHRESLQIELLQRTDALRAALLSSVSHDLRTPLSSIKASASSLLQEDVQWNEEERRSFAFAIEREADRLNRLVGNLLDMSRIEGGALKPEKEWYPLDELIHDVLGHMESVLQGRSVQVTIPDDVPPVELDYLQMDQVLTNLLENAARYTPSESAIEIDVQVQVAHEELVISIADHGPGIPPTDIERIFDKFYRVLGVQRNGTIGSGLGLAVCRGLVEAHGGHIWAENREEGGAVFRFTLPVEKAEEKKHE